MKKVRDAEFSWKRSGNAGSGPPLPDPVNRGVFWILVRFTKDMQYHSCNTSTTRASVSSRYPNTEKLMKARDRRPVAFIVSRCLDTLMKHEARVVDMTSQSRIINNRQLTLYWQAKFVFFCEQKLVISTKLVVCNAGKNATFFRKPFMAMLIFALASFSIAFNRDRTTFGIILFRLQESCRDKKSLLTLCRPKSKLQEGRSGSGKWSES